MTFTKNLLISTGLLGMSASMAIADSANVIYTYTGKHWAECRSLEQLLTETNLKQEIKYFGVTQGNGICDSGTQDADGVHSGIDATSDRLSYFIEMNDGTIIQGAANSAPEKIKSLLALITSEGNFSLLSCTGSAQRILDVENKELLFVFLRETVINGATIETSIPATISLGWMTLESCTGTNGSYQPELALHDHRSFDGSPHSKREEQRRHQHTPNTGDAK